MSYTSSLLATLGPDAGNLGAETVRRGRGRWFWWGYEPNRASRAAGIRRISTPSVAVHPVA